MLIDLETFLYLLEQTSDADEIEKKFMKIIKSENGTNSNQRFLILLGKVCRKNSFIILFFSGICDSLLLVKFS